MDQDSKQPLITYKDWLNNRIDKKVKSYFAATHKLDELLEKQHIDQSTYDGIQGAAKEALDKARRLNHEILTNRLLQRVKNSPNPDELIKIEKQHRKEVLDNHPDAYYKVLSGELHPRPINGSDYQAVIDKYQQVLASPDIEKAGFEPILNLENTGPWITLRGPVRETRLNGHFVPIADPQNELLMVITNYDLLEFVNTHFSKEGIGLSNPVITIIINALQDSMTLEPTSSRERIKEQLINIGLFTQGEGSPENGNSGSVAKLLSKLKNNRLSNPKKYEGHFNEAIQWLHLKGYEEAKDQAAADKEALLNQHKRNR